MGNMATAPAAGLNRPMRMAVRAGLSLACVVAAAWLLSGWQAERSLTRAQHSLSAGQPRRALAQLPRARDGDVRGRAATIASAARLRLGDLAGAERELAAASVAMPVDWQTRYDDAVLLQRMGRDAQAAAQMSAAHELNPRQTLPPGFAR